MKDGLSSEDLNLTGTLNLLQGGSPLSQKSLQCDSTAITGSPKATGWIKFGESFNSAPVVLANLDNGASELSVASVNAGSFKVTAVTAGTYSGNVLWIALGSGAPS